MCHPALQDATDGLTTNTSPESTCDVSRYTPHPMYHVVVGATTACRHAVGGMVYAHHGM